jgi:hypothetical protein
MIAESQRRRSDLSMLALAVVYIVVGLVLFYLELTGAISTTFFGIGILILIVVSLVFKFATDFQRRRRMRT